MTALMAQHTGDSDGDDASQLIDLPSAKRGPKSLKALAVQCREKLSLLQNATYLCQSENAFIVLDSNLKEALSAFNSSLYRDSGLCTEAEHIKKKKAVKRPATQKDVESKKIKMEENMKERKKKSKRGNKRLPLKLQKTEPICSERVIIEGHEAVPNTIQEDIAGTLLFVSFLIMFINKLLKPIKLKISRILFTYVVYE